MRLAMLRLSGSCFRRNNHTDVTFSQLRWLRTNLSCSLSTQMPPQTNFRHSLNTKYFNRLNEPAQRNYSTTTSTSVNNNTRSVLCYHYHCHSLSFHGEKKRRHFEFFRSFACQKVESPLEQAKQSAFQISPLDTSQNSEEALAVDHDSFSNEPQTEVFSAEEAKDLPEMSRTVYNLSPYVQKSETLQNLVKIGVDLSKVEKFKGMASMLLMSDFDRDVLPYLHHLARVGVPPDKLGYILTVNPLILTETVEHLQERVGYLLSKDFVMDDVASMYTRAPVMIRMNPEQLDRKLGFLQQVFGLTDSEVRQVALTFPKILPWKKELIANMRFHMKEFMGFHDKDLALMILREPKLFTANKHKVLKTFDYLCNTMLVPLPLLVQSPKSLRYRLHIVKARHLFLVRVGRAQYDPCQENYVSMKRLLEGPDHEFCSNVAKSTQDEFYSFLKTL